MSKQFFLKSTPLLFVGFVIGYGFTSILKNQISSSSSDEISMSSIAEENSSGRTLTKLGTESIYQEFFDIRIKNVNISKAKDGTSDVVAVITARKNIPEGLSFKWIMGEGVSAVSESTTGVLGSLEKNEVKEVPLKVFGFNKSIQSYLSFDIDGEITGFKIKKSVLASSRPEDSFEYLVQNESQREIQEQKNSNSTKGQVKITNSKKSKFDLSNVIK